MQHLELSAATIKRREIDFGQRLVGIAKVIQNLSNVLIGAVKVKKILLIKCERQVDEACNTDSKMPTNPMWYFIQINPYVTFAWSI